MLLRTAAELAALRTRPRRLLCVFPHPDDESYGPAGTLARAGFADDAAAVYLCLTRGEASAMGPQRGLTPDEVAALREERLLGVADALALNGLVIADLPDGGMAARSLDELAAPIAAVLDAFAPQVVIGHDARGVNAHPDHIASHWALRFALRGRPPVRFAMMAYPPEVVEAVKPRLLFATPEERIDAVVHLTPREIEAKERCLRLHEAFVTVKEDGPEGLLRRPPIERYAFFDGRPAAPVDDLFAGLAC